ncbi:hypothetical protein Btru_019760 [Bulinus truncatus]|nr:hypothetical protein Btru_019760 [Bulinus truncatus]
MPPASPARHHTTTDVLHLTTTDVLHSLTLTCPVQLHVSVKMMWLTILQPSTLMKMSLFIHCAFALISLSNGVLTDWTALDIATLIKPYSSACQVTYMLKSANLYPTTFCSADMLPPFYARIVKRGFCNNNEFNMFTASVCNKKYTGKQDSEAKTVFDAAVSGVSFSCQAKMVDCLESSSISNILKQQEMYCSLMALKVLNGNTESCLTTGDQNRCSVLEFRQIQGKACASNKTTVSQRFSNAVLSTSLNCQNAFSKCAQAMSFEKDWPAAQNAVVNEKYCVLLGLKKIAFNFKICLTANRCTEAEFSLLNKAACEEQTSREKDDDDDDKDSRE